jgi:integrase
MEADMDGGTQTRTSGRGLDKLSHRAVDEFKKAAVAGSKLFDGGGLYLWISPAGSALWRIKYRYDRAERTYSVGPYPGVSLASARVERDALKDKLRAGRDPVEARRTQRAEAAVATDETFEKVARDWIEKRRKWSKVHREKSTRALERDVFPYIGRLPVAEITPGMVSAVVERIGKRGAHDTAAKVLQHVTRVFELARAKNGLRDNPAYPAAEALPERDAAKPRPALLKWPELGAVLRSAEVASLSPAVRQGHRLCAFTAVRISNVVEAEWREFDLEAEPPLWIIPRRKMKKKEYHHDHRVILGPTIAAELRTWRQTIGGKGFVFPSPASHEDAPAHITRESIEKAYRVTLGLEDRHTPHGWRSALSTRAKDDGGFERDVVELALDHIHDNDVVRAYDRGERLSQRVKLMQWWDTELSRAQAGADVVPLRASK